MAESTYPVETSKHSADSVSMKIVQQVATVTNQEVTQLPPLYNTIDPEALDAIVNSVATSPSSPVIQFSYAEHQVTINGVGAVSIESSNS